MNLELLIAEKDMERGSREKGGFLGVISLTKCALFCSHPLQLVNL
jgi:hypothetical protein